MTFADEEERLRKLTEYCRSDDLDNIEALLSAVEREDGDALLTALRRACDEMSTSEFSDRQRARRLIERYARAAIDRAGHARLDLQLHLLVTHLRVNAQATVPRDWARIRRESAELWCRVWGKLERAIDPTWREGDPANNVQPFTPPEGTPAPPGGAGPEAIGDPKLRAAYEAHLKRNREVSERNSLQLKARRLKAQYSKQVVDYLAGIYSEPPRRLDELEAMMESKLEPKLRSEVLAQVGDN